MSPCLPTSPGSAGTLISSLPAGKLSRWCASLRIQIALRLRRLITRIPLHSPHGGGSGERRGKVFGATLRAHGTFVWALGFGGRGSDLGGLGASEGGFWCSFCFLVFFFRFQCCVCVNVEDRDVGFSVSACVYGSLRENYCVLCLFLFLRSRSEAQGTRSAKQMLLVFFFVFFSVLL